MQIIDYEDKYKKDIIDFLIEIAVNEFNHLNWIDYLKNKDFTPYLLDNSKFVIMLENEKIIATIGALKVDEDTIKINSFYIKKEYRSKKLGTNLYNIILNFCIEQNYKKIILCTYDEYKIAKKFYSKNGFSLYKTDGNEQWMVKNIERKDTYEN